jgi:UDP-glucose 4-epimerase
MKILITGGAGFIGSHIVEYFQGKAAVVVLDNFRSGFRENLSGLSCTIIEGSVTDPVAVQEAVKGADYVFHLAAMISVPESMAKPRQCVEINTQGTLVVLEEAARAGVKKLCFSSSAAIYGDNPRLPKSEDLLPEPQSPYAVTKLDGEHYCRIWNDKGWLPTACMRYFNVFGPRQDPKSPYAAAVPIFIDKSLRDEPITLFGDGLQTRDFVYVQNVASANVRLATQPGLSGVFNVASGVRISIRELAERIITWTQSKSSIQFGPERPGDIKHSLACVHRARQAGLVSGNGFDLGLKATMDWYRKKQRRTL